MYQFFDLGDQALTFDLVLFCLRFLFCLNCFVYVLRHVASSMDFYLSARWPVRELYLPT